MNINLKGKDLKRFLLECLERSAALFTSQYKERGPLLLRRIIIGESIKGDLGLFLLCLVSMHRIKSRISENRRL